jgi:hypothetical protein
MRQIWKLPETEERGKLTRGFRSLPAALHTIALVACVSGVLAGLGFDHLIR